MAWTKFIAPAASFSPPELRWWPLEVRLYKVLAGAWKILRPVGKIGVHLDHAVEVVRQRPPKAVDVGAAESSPSDTMQYLDRRVCPRNLIGESAGSVRYR